MKKFLDWLRSLFRPAQVVVDFCPVVEKLASPECIFDMKRQFAKGKEPKETCTHHFVTVCAATGLLPNPYCPVTMKDCLLETPAATCALHVKPYPADTPKPDWMPRMYLAWLSGHVLLGHYSDKQLEAFAAKISAAGVDYVRIMMCWDDPNYQSIMTTIQPFNKVAGTNVNDLDQPNPAFDLAVARLRDALLPYHVRLHFDLFDNCDSANSPWAVNCNGIDGIYDSTSKAVYYFKLWAQRIMDLLPSDDLHRIGIGNELRYPDDAMGPEMEAWVRGVVLPLGEMLHMAGYLPTTFSAFPNTGHWIHGALSPDVSHLFGIRDSVLQVHGQALLEDFDPAYGSDIRAYGYSDDGATVKENGKKGYCTKYPRCQATLAERVKLITAWWAKYGEPKYSQRRLDHIEFLPGEISDGEAPDQILPESLDVYNAISTQLWGIQITRK